MSDNPHKTSLNNILALTRARVEALKSKRRVLEQAARDGRPVRPFPKPGAVVGIIAEVKRRSPSQGAIREDLDPVTHASAYARGGAVAISVLTDEAHFGGSIDDLRDVAAAIAVPVLRKDFVIDESQVFEARGAGASAVLLIARVLPADRLHALAHLVRDCDMTALVEVHAASELDAALAAGPSVIGVNARDLDTFVVDAAAAERLIARVPRDIAVVGESGVETRRDVERFATAGADFVLVGTSVARTGDPETAVRALVGVKRERGVRA
jgi:indole-3-glycerol phosphate synthase